MPQYVLGLDGGTESCRAGIFDRQGTHPTWPADQCDSSSKIITHTIHTWIAVQETPLPLRPRRMRPDFPNHHGQSKTRRIGGVCVGSCLQ